MSIPKIIFRTVPETTADQVEKWWVEIGELHPGWELITYRDPLPPEDFPLTSQYWGACQTGAQKAGLIRLEGLLKHGGIYLDSDVSLFKRLDTLLQLEGFACWEDPNTVPDAVLGAKPGHPAIAECLELAISRLVANSGEWKTDGPWGTGPGVTTTVLPTHDDILLLPPACFFPVHYNEKGKLHRHKPAPYEFGMHWWEASWLK